MMPGSPAPNALPAIALACFSLGCGAPTITPVDSAATHSGTTSPVPTNSPAAAISTDLSQGALPFTTALSGLESTGDALSYAWTLDDGTTSSEASFSHTWLSTGTHTVSLDVTDTSGLTSSDAVELQVLTAACPEAGTYEQIGQVTAPELIEISGLAHSRKNPGVLWVHNDARNAPALYALDETGMLLGVFTLDISYGDWEDIAIGTNAAGEAVIFVGSVGNNDRDRETLAILVVPEPTVALGGRIDGELTFHEMVLEFPGGPFNSESIAWDPQTGDLLVLTKEPSGLSTWFRTPAPHDEPVVVLEFITTLTFGDEPLPGGAATTAATVSPLGDLVAVRTYNALSYVWRRDANDSWAQTFATAPCPVLLIPEQQGESLDFSLDGQALLSIREGLDAPINRTALDGPISP